MFCTRAYLFVFKYINDLDDAAAIKILKCTNDTKCTNDNCASWIQHEHSGCEKKWADTRVGGFVFTCKGCTEVAALAKEVDGLKQMVEDMKEMVAGLRLEDKGAETGSRVTTTGVNQDREEAAGKNRTEEMVTGVDDEG